MYHILVMGALLKRILLQNETEHPPYFYKICFRKHFKHNFDKKKQTFFGPTQWRWSSKFDVKGQIYSKLS